MVLYSRDDVSYFVVHCSNSIIFDEMYLQFGEQLHTSGR